MISHRQADLFQSIDKAAHPVVGLVFTPRGVKDQGPRFTTYEYKNSGLKLPDSSSGLTKIFRDVPSINVSKHDNPNDSSGFTWSTEHTQLANFVWSKDFDFMKPPLEYSADNKEITVWVKKR